MFCPQCGTQNEDNAQTCRKCGGQLADVPAPGPAATGFPGGDGVPDEIKHFNFGAFAMIFIWAFAHRLWLLGILLILPIVNIIPAIYIGIKGNELAWKARPFKSVQQFKDTQRVWTIFGIIFFCFYSFLIVVGILAALAIPSFIAAKDKARFHSCIRTMSEFSVAQDMYMVDNGIYTDNFDRLAKHIFAECYEDDGSDCTGRVVEKITGSCDNPAISFREGDDSGFWYRITAETRDRYNCKICITPAGVMPDDYGMCDRDMELICP